LFAQAGGEELGAELGKRADLLRLGHEGTQAVVSGQVAIDLR
jgi:hypothetical protein